jgi:hypothetical protein
MCEGKVSDVMKDVFANDGDLAVDLVEQLDARAELNCAWHDHTDSNVCAESRKS